jgi:hypothetical protein
MMIQRSRELHTIESPSTQPQRSTPPLASAWMLAIALCTLSPQALANNAGQTMRQLENSLVTVEVKTVASDTRVGTERSPMYYTVGSPLRCENSLGVWGNTRSTRYPT